MKTIPFLLFPVVIFLLNTGCNGHEDLKEDASGIADAMCRSIEIMNDLKKVSPDDTAKIDDLQSRYQYVQSEMEVLYSDFRKKYETRMKDPRFSKDFSRELRKAILNCRYLSKEDREKYEKEAE